MSRKRTYDQTFRMKAVSLVNTSKKSIAAVFTDYGQTNVPPLPSFLTFIRVIG